MNRRRFLTAKEVRAMMLAVRRSPYRRTRSLSDLVSVSPWYAH